MQGCNKLSICRKRSVCAAQWNEVCLYFTLKIAGDYPTVWIYHILLIHSPLADVFLAIMNNVAMNIHAHAFVGTVFSLLLALHLGVELLGHTVILCLSFWGTTKVFSTVFVPFYIPTFPPKNLWGFRFQHIHTSTLNVCQRLVFKHKKSEALTWKYRKFWTTWNHNGWFQAGSCLSGSPKRKV